MFSKPARLLSRKGDVHIRARALSSPAPFPKTGRREHASRARLPAPERGLCNSSRSLKPPAGGSWNLHCPNSRDAALPTDLVQRESGFA